MPSSFDEYPINFSDEELEWLEGCDKILEKVDKYKNQIKRDYEKICKKVWEFGNWTEKEYRDAFL